LRKQEGVVGCVGIGMWEYISEGEVVGYELITKIG